MSFRDALGVWRRFGDAAALPALLDAWRTTRSPRGADVLERVSDRIAPEVLPGDTPEARRDAWMVRARSAHPGAFSTLDAALWPERWQLAYMLFAFLATWPHDPRMARLLAEVVRERPWREPGADRMYTAAASHLQTLGDTRVMRMLPLPEPAETSRDRAVVHLHEVLGRVHPTPLEPDEESALDAFLAALDAEDASRQALWDAVLASPEDDAPRRLLADERMERGDPWGTFLALQLDGRPEAVAESEALRERVGRRWIPAPIRIVAVPGTVRFERGTVVAATIPAVLDPMDVACLADPCWSTLTALRLEGAGPRALLEQPWFLALRTVEGGSLDLWVDARARGARW